MIYVSTVYFYGLMALNNYALMFLLHIITNEMFMEMFKCMFYASTKIKCDGLWNHGLKWKVLYDMEYGSKYNVTIRIWGAYGCHPSPRLGGIIIIVFMK